MHDGVHVGESRRKDERNVRSTPHINDDDEERRSRGYARNGTYAA